MRPAAPASEALDRAIVAAPLTAAPDASIASVAALMAAAAGQHPHAAARASCVLVLGADAAPRLLAQGDIVRLVASGAPADATPAGAVAAPARCAPRAALGDVADALRLMGDAGHLVLLDEAGGVCGLLTPASLLPLLAAPAPLAADERAGLVAERQRVERELRESQGRLRQSEAHLVTAQRIAALGSWEFDVATGEMTCSEEIFHIFGRDRALGAPSFDEFQTYVAAEERAAHRKAVDVAVTQGEPYEIELRINRAGDEPRVCQARGAPIHDEWGRVFRLVGTLLDITERRRTEEQLRALADRLALAARSAAMGIWDWDVVADVLTWDERMYELYGLTPTTFSNAYDGWASGLHPDDRVETEAAIQRALSGEREYAIEFRVVRPDKSVRMLKAFAVVQRGPGGEPLRMIGVNYDITEQRRAEDQLRATSAQLATANHELQAFAYSVSHDLRAPLRAIDGFSQALVEDYDHLLDAEARAYLRRIRDGVKRMSQLIDDLLQLSRVSRAEMSEDRVDLSALVTRICAELRETNPGRVVELRIAPGVTAWGDVNLLRVALDNLLANAWKFTGQRERALIEFGVARAEGSAVYFVRDNGAGYDPAYARKLFGVFQRLHDAHEFPGTGIGLATVQRVIHRHGGQVWSEGAVGQGATFSFTLPGGRLREER